MAKKPPPAPQDIRLSPAEMRAGIARFHRRIKDVEAFEPEKVTDRRDPNIDALEASIAEALSQTFGHDTPTGRLYRPAATLDTAGINMNGTPHHKVIEGLVRGKARALVLLNQAIKSFEEQIADQIEQDGSAGQLTLMEAVPETTRQEPSRDIFIVHGHDVQFKNQVSDVLRRAGLNPVVLHEQPNGGRTIIEKFEKHGAAAGFAVVLLTPDDVGGPTPEQLQPRARQNVIGEMFWFAGKLGRSHVCALRKGEVEVPSDFAGVVYTAVDDRGAWKTDLLKELQAAGYTDLNWGSALS
ncbi:nucleotide-binding protein [Bradyrhizobium sp. LjRoot220]|uniref:TIR domain-containing protein n=1 Tax=Bradyrhizobium sp. LjRoot220 TaxID=3342284 RepID=UPI003ECD4C99